MNNAMKSAIEAVKNNNNDETKKALAELAVYKFKKVNGRIQQAVRTINRHLGVNSGTPNRSKLAIAVGLTDEVVSYAEVANLIDMPRMKETCDKLLATIAKIGEMRKNRKYTEMEYLPDFLTDAEEKALAVYDAKCYLAALVGGVNNAIDTINCHIVEGDFDVNTFKVAKAIGYADEIVALRGDFTTFTTNDEKFDNELAVVDAVANTIDEVIKSKANGFRLAIKKLKDYNPDYCPCGEDCTDDNPATEG